MKRHFAPWFLLVLLLTIVLIPPAAAQTSAASTFNSALPRLVRFGGVLKDLNGDPLTGIVGVTFALYSEQNGGAALWLETQNVNADGNGRYSVLLGATKPDGLPSELFTSEQARWVGVQVSGQAEQSRVLLVSAPYALKAGDAETIGGLPPSAFVLATPTASGANDNTASIASTSAPPPGSSTVTTSGGTANTIPLFSTSTDIENSVISQAGSGTTAKVGIGTTTPASTLDIKGGATIRGTASVMGTLSLASTGTATTTAGKNSEPESFVASSYNSSSSSAANQTFQWQAEPAGNDTSAPSGTLNLLFGEGTAKPAETGLHIASNGQITFAVGQTFPGAGSGTVTSVASGAGLTGGPITGSGTLSIATGGVTNAMLATPSLTITAGTDLTGGGSVALGGSTTIGLNLSATDARYAQLGASDTFTGTLNISTSSTSVSATTSSGANAIYADNTSSTGTGVTGIGSTGVAGQSVTGTGVVGTVTGSSGTGVYGIATGTSGGANGVYASSSTPTGSGVVAYASGTGDGVYASNTDTSGSGNGVYAVTTSASGTGVVGVNFASSPKGYGVYGQINASTSGATGVYGNAATTPPGTAATYGVYGISSSQFPGSAGVYGYNAQDAISDPRIYGVYGALKTPDGGAGVGGTGSTISGTGSGYSAFGAGVWGDADPNGYFGVFGTADDNVAIGAINSSGTDTDKPALLAQNNSTTAGALVFTAVGGTDDSCTIDVAGNLGCSGTVNAIARTDSGRQVSLFGMSSTESWFEDFGSGQLSGGSAVISLDAKFASTVNTSESYHVFLTPNGDCKGLYVASKTANGFEVRELGGGTSSISFDYRIVAKRRGYENARMQDVTDQMEHRRQAREKLHSGGQAVRKLAVPPQPLAPNLGERTPQGPRPVALSVSKPISAPRP